MMKARIPSKKGQVSLLRSTESSPVMLSDDLTPAKGKKASRGGFGNEKKTWRTRLFRNSNSNAASSKQSSDAFGDAFGTDPFGAATPDGWPADTGVSSPTASKGRKSGVVSPTQKRGSTKKVMYIPERQPGQSPRASPSNKNNKASSKSKAKQGLKSILRAAPPLDASSNAAEPASNAKDAPLIGGTASSPAPSTVPVSHNAETVLRASSLGDGKPPPKHQISQSQQFVQEFFNRPFGREHIDAVMPWRVHVSPAEWDEQSWKYRVGVSFRRDDDAVEYTDPNITLRSLSHFCWLEQALHHEFQGALIIPSLAIKLGIPGDLNDVLTEVDESLLQEWLSDVLNGIRGQGEWIVSREGIDLLGSESVETFFHRCSHPYDLPHPMDVALTPVSILFSDQEETKNDHATQYGPRITTTLWAWLGTDLCGDGAWQNVSDDQMAMHHNKYRQQRGAMRFPLSIANCSSPALGDARSLHVQDSMVDMATVEGAAFADESNFVNHLELIKAEKELVWNWRRRCLITLEKARLWAEYEQKAGGAWKRFAISLSNLFSFEKDIETTKFGESAKRHTLHFPYRKLQKSVVDDCLRILARQKLERSIPALEALQPFVSAYVADLSAIGPSTEAYLHGVAQCVHIQKHAAKHRSATSTPASAPTSPSRSPQSEQPTSLTDQLRAGIRVVHKQLGGGEGDNNTANTSIMSDEEQLQQQQQVHMVQDNVLRNEVVLKDVLTSMCKSSKMRTCRMAYRYFNVEAVQCAVLHSAATTLRGKVSVASKESITKLINKHHTGVKEDHATEMQLVQRIVNISNNKKFLKEDDGTTEEIEQGVEIDKGVENEEAAKAALRDKAFQICRERVGRWNPKLSMAIMEAVGVDDASVRVEETTRELRQVRKFAVGLREHVEQCEEALAMLRDVATSDGQHEYGELLSSFMTELKHMLSGNCISAQDDSLSLDSASLRRLRDAGIALNDPCGWEVSRTGSCGKPFRAYTEKRRSETKWLVDSLEALLQEYNERVEHIESFVFMECVGIQLEKHFNQSRTKTLAAFEKKTDLTSAINIAKRKMPQLVGKLKDKLENVDLTVSHTAVKEAKEAHLESKTLKSELHDLAIRRLSRSRESSTERVISLMSLWAKEEESAASDQLMILKDIVKTLEKTIKIGEIRAFHSSPRVP